MKNYNCNGCVFLINNKCTHENRKEKSWLFMIDKNTEYTLDFRKNTNNYYICEYFKDKKKKQ